MLDLHKVCVFAIVAQEGSFSRAAERLYVTQSAVSQHIKDLEHMLGQPLFERSWRGVTLTSHGEVLYGYARQIVALAIRAEQELANISQISGGKVTIGATTGAGIYLAPRWVQRFRMRYSRLTVALQTSVTAQVIADVLAHRLDMGFIEGDLDRQRPDRLQALDLAEIEQLVVVGPKHRLWDSGQIPLSALHQQSFIVRPASSQSRQWLESTLRQHGIDMVIGAEFDNLEAIKRTLAVGVCMSVLPAYVIQDEIDHGLLRALAVTDQPLKRTLRLIWDRDLPFSPIARAFLVELSADFPTLNTLLNSRS